MKRPYLKQNIKLNLRTRKTILIALSFALPILVLTLALLALLITPFGKHNLCISDARFYINGEMFFARLLKGQENWLYSFNDGLGANEWGQLAWGGIAIANVLSVFATLETIPTVFTWICVVSMAICGLTMYLLLAELRGHQLSNLIFSTSYALMGFNVANCYQILFFIGPQMLPLMVLGLIRLMKGKSPLLYVLSLDVCIFCNFYFGFMLCVASVLLFAAILSVREKELTGELRQRFRVYMTSSVVAGLLAAPMWLPAIKAFTGGEGRMNQTGLDEFRFKENMPFLQMFSKLFSGANSTNEQISGMPNIFCGILVVALVILFFLNHRIPKRTRGIVGVLLVFYLLTFYITAFTLVMHGGTHTNWFPYRYSFVFSFLLIGIAAEQFCYLPELTLAETKRCGIILILATLMVFSVKYEFISGASVLLDLSLLLLMWFAFYMYKIQPEKAPLRTVSLFLLLVVCMNLYANFAISIYKVREWELDLETYSKNVLYSGGAIEGITMYDSDFYRLEKGKSESISVGADSYLYNYNGVSHSGPTERMFVHRQLNKLGISWYDMRHWYEDGVPAATDSLLGVKYLYSEEDLEAEKGYENRVETMKGSIFENHSVLPIAVLTNKEVSSLELGFDCFENLNSIWRAMTGGEKDIFTPETEVTFSLHNAEESVDVTAKELSESVKKAESAASQAQENAQPEDQSKARIDYSFRAKQDGPVYCFDTSIPDSDSGLSVASIKCLGVFQKGEKVTHSSYADQESLSSEVFRGYCANLAFAYANNDVLAEYAKKLNARDITFNVEHENDLTGTFTAEANQRILFTIPWDEGWTCYIDGQKVPIDKTWDLFMSVDVPEGEHTYEMKFFPAWMDIGIGLSAAALVGLVALMVGWKRNQRRQQESEQR